jgi:hypothetical protein
MLWSALSTQTFVINSWPWTLTPLTARVMCGWVALLGVGAFTMSNETALERMEVRWKASPSGTCWSSSPRS